MLIKIVVFYASKLYSIQTRWSIILVDDDIYSIY